MQDNVFFDTNVLIYLYSRDEPQKRSVIENLFEAHNQIILSTQVLNEFINVMRKKRAVDTKSLIKAIKELCAQFTIMPVNVVTIEHALDIASKYGYTYFDSLIIASALEGNCAILYTEDLHHNQCIEEKLYIKNPFNNTK